VHATLPPTALTVHWFEVHALMSAAHTYIRQLLACGMTTDGQWTWQDFSIKQHAESDSESQAGQPYAWLCLCHIAMRRASPPTPHQSPGIMLLASLATNV
jgi:hypothetical protein